jgi:DNA-binding NarL/FixJ family response regulator
MEMRMSFIKASSTMPLAVLGLQLAANAQSIPPKRQTPAAAAARSVILVVDAHGVYRAGLREVIQDRFPCSHVVEVPKLSCVGSNRFFDLILIDSGSLSYETLDLLVEFYEARPTTMVAVMLTSRTRTEVLHYLSVGFHGVMHKFQPDEELLAAVGDLLSGRIYVPTWLADTYDEDRSRPSPADIQQETLKLTPRQNEVMHLLARGMSNKEVARELKIAEGTSKIHTAALLRALGARNRTEAAFLAAKLVHPAKSLCVESSWR